MLRKIANVLFVVGLLPWVVVFLLGAMLFDAPGSENSPLTRGLYYAIAVYPLLVIVGFFGSAGFWRLRDDQRWRRHLALLPLLSPVTAGLCLVAIELLCGGRFACRP